MRLHPDSPRGRRGFTLIELLVVMAIIAVLVGLLLAGVMSVLAAKDRRTTQFEISKLDESMKVAMQQYGLVKTLPSRLLLHNDINKYRTQNDIDTKRTGDVLRKMFGSRLISNGTAVNWDGSGNVANSSLLEGQQCLVFYLGGIGTSTPNGVKMEGFSVNPLDPTAPGGARIGPFYEFKTSRLAGGFGAPAGFYSYLDPYGTIANGRPYAYFGGTGAANTYINHCPSLDNVQAYFESPGKFTNPTSFQIISAGANQVFGPGGLWNPTVGIRDLNGSDDLSNFSTNVLGAPQS